MPGVSYKSASILGAFLECVMYGVFVPFFIAACYVQWERLSDRRGINRLMGFATAFFGLTVTTNFVISLYQAVQATLYTGSSVHQSASPPFPAESIAWFTILYLQVVVADVIIVYRMYHIYDKNPYVCVIPSITITALFVAGCGVTNQLRDKTSNAKALANWSAASFSLTVFNNLFLTASISFKLWGVHRQTTRAGILIEDSIVLRAIRVLIESAALWTTFSTMNFISFLAKSNLTFTFLAMSGPAVGISFCLIIVRLGKVLPEARDKTLEVSIRTPASRTPVPDRLAISFPQVDGQQDTWVSGPKDLPMRRLGSRTEGYGDSSGDLSKPLRSSLSTPM